MSKRHMTPDAPEQGKLYRFGYYIPTEASPTGIAYYVEPTKWPWRGDWQAARRKNPTIERSIEGEPFESNGWPEGGWMGPERVPELPKGGIAGPEADAKTGLGIEP